MSDESYKSEISATQLARAHMGDQMFGANPHSEYEERIAELEAQLAEAEVRMDAMEADLAQARLLIVAIDENLDMCKKWTLTTERIAELLHDPARNPWAALMRAGKEGGE